MLLKKITQTLILLLLIFKVGCVSKTDEINRPNYSLGEIYEMLCLPLSNSSKVVSPSISGRVTRHDFQDRGLGESEAKQILKYLKVKGIIDANGKFGDAIDLGPGAWIKVDKNNIDIQNILRGVEENRPRGPGFNTETTIEELAYNDLESLINVVLTDCHPKYSSKSGYSYFMDELEGNKINLGTRYTEDHEYRFEEKDIITDGIRFFRDKNNIVKIVCTYDINSRYSIENEVGAVFSEMSGDVVMDTLTETDGYIVFFIKRDYPERLLEKEYYLMMARKGNISFTATISRSLFTEDELDRMDKSIKSDPEVWGSYFSAESPGKYLPGSGPDEGVRPGSGDVISPYSSKQNFSE